MNKLQELFPAAKLSIARVSPMNQLSLLLLGAAVTLCPAVAANLNPVNLGSAGTFAVLAGTGVTNTGPSVITGDLGVYPVAGTSVTGFFGENAGGPGRVIGTIQDNDTALETFAAAHAQASLTIAFNDAKGRTGAFTPANTDLSMLTLTPGLYRADNILLITGKKLFLQGDGVYIFQIGTGLTVGDGTEIVLENGAQAANVFWQVGTQATLGSGVIFKGNILAGTAITMKAGTTLAGRALAKANVTFISDTVTLPAAQLVRTRD
jgi:Ice-binding-like